MKQITSVDGTIPIQALLNLDELHLASQPSVGLYWGQLKAPRHQNGTIHLTSHRLIYHDSQHPARNSLAVSLSSISESEHYSGFLTSSPKVSVVFREQGTPLSSPSQDQWTCQVCDENNPGGDQCILCGVPRNNAINQPQPPLASSLPSSLHEPIPSPAVSDLQIACNACTFLNSKYLTSCEICGTPLPDAQAKASSKSAPISRLPSPGPEGLDDPEDLDITTFKISFRKGGDKPFYTQLKRALKSKAWAKPGSSRPSADTNSRLGIHGLLTTLEATSVSQSATLADAFQDLDVFAIKARDTLEIARQFNAKLQTQSQNLEPEEARLVRGSLMSLGLNSTGAPTVNSGGEQELVQEVASVLQGSRRGANSLMKSRGIVGLDEVWGAWMRFRGVSLLPPTTLPPLLPLLSAYTDPPLFVRTLPGGVEVVCTQEWTPESSTRRIVDSIREREMEGTGGMTTFEISLKLAVSSKANVGVGLIASMVDECEAMGVIWRDDPHTGGLDEAQTGAGPRWWVNVCVDGPNGWQWDGQE